MKEISVTYRLTDEAEKRLWEITEKYKADGLDMTLDETFAFIMETGSFHDIDRKLRWHEQMFEHGKEEVED